MGTYLTKAENKAEQIGQKIKNSKLGQKIQNSKLGQKIQNNKTEQNINYARAAVTLLTAIFALSTLVLTGQMMDYANFPGSNIQFENLNKSFAIKSSTCSNFVNITNGDNNKVCGSVNDDMSHAIDILNSEKKTAANTDVARGWTVVPPCVKKLNKDGQMTGDCDPFSNGSALAVCGGFTFVFLSLGSVLFGAHTAIIDNGKKSTCQYIFWVANIVWTVLSFSLSIWAAIAWVGMCDKLDTGLGRYDTDGRACATRFCTMSFESFTLSFVSAIILAHIPNLLIFTERCGVANADNVANADKKDVEEKKQLVNDNNNP